VIDHHLALVDVFAPPSTSQRELGRLERGEPVGVEKLVALGPFQNVPETSEPSFQRKNELTTPSPAAKRKRASTRPYP
jgi:hypothetical protein